MRECGDSAVDALLLLLQRSQLLLQPLDLRELLGLAVGHGLGGVRRREESEEVKVSLALVRGG